MNHLKVITLIILISLSSIAKTITYDWKKTKDYKSDQQIKEVLSQVSGTEVEFSVSGIMKDHTKLFFKSTKFDLDTSKTPTDLKSYAVGIAKVDGHSDVIIIYYEIKTKTFRLSMPVDKGAKFTASIRFLYKK